MDTFIAYIQDHVALTVVLAVILVLIVALVVLLAVEIARGKKRKGEETAEKETPIEREAPDEEPIQEPTEEQTEEPEERSEETSEEPPAEPAPQKTDETPGFVFVPVKKSRPAPEATEEEQMKQEKKAKPAAAPVAAKKKPAKKETVGKWVLYEEERGGYGFKLVASNGEVMIKSSSPYASLSSAKSGVKTYQDNIAAGRLEVVETKKGNFFVQVNNASKRLLATSADYKTRSSCESAMESIKRWAATTIIVVENPDEDDKK